MAKSSRVAIIGAGMAGMACAQSLYASGHDVQLFDKGRGPGGRMSARRVTIGNVEVAFDHGAQYFTACDAAFCSQVEIWQAAGLVAPWPAASADAWVGTPAMNAPLADMVARLPVRFSTKVTRIDRSGEVWELVNEAGDTETFDAVVVAVPAEQVSALVSAHAPAFASLAQQTASEPCWTVMVAFAGIVPSQADVLRPAGVIGWAARNNSKPRRAPVETWVIQATPDWSRRHKGAVEGDVVAELLKAFQVCIGEDLPEATFVKAHSWLYARSGSAGRTCLWDPELKLGVCGDWLVGPRVEGAWLSGTALAVMMATLAQ